MKKLLLHVPKNYPLLLLFCFNISFSNAQVLAKQKPAPEPVINVPLSGSINALYYAVPSPLSGDEDNVTYVNINGTKGNKDTQCAQRALTHLKQYLNTYVGFMASKAGVDVGLKVGTGVAKMMPLSGGASLAIDLFSFALKGAMTESPDELSEMVQKEAINKLGSKVADKLESEDAKKELTGAIGDLVDQLYKKMESSNIDKDFKNDCNGHLNIHYVKVGLNHFKMVFKASGDCQCNNKDKPLGPWEVSGEMDATVTGITQRAKLGQSFREVEYDMGLSWGKPTFYITADCNCNLKTSYMNGGSGYQPFNPGSSTIGQTENVSYQAFVGGSVISEDSDPRFNTYGVDAQFTDFLNEQLGLTAEAGLNFGSQYSVNYSKFTLMAGATIIPLQVMALNAKINFFTHLLLGISAIHASVGTYSATNTTFAGQLGAGINIPLKKGLWVRPAEFDYQFATPKGGLSSNIKFTAGIVATIPFVK